MPKKTASARGSAQRNKPKVQKNIELVRPITVSDDVALETTSDSAEAAPMPAATSVDTMATPTAKSSASVRTRSATRPKVSASSLATVPTKKEDESAKEPVAAAASTASTAAAPKSAAARLAARRQANQKSQRSAATLITAEHYSYVRHDLAFIAILAAIMFAAIIVLHFVPGIGS